MSVVIHGIPGSPYVRAALMGCEEKGVAYEFHRMAMGEPKQPAHLARHPFGRIPAFEHDGFTLYETQAILRYVDAAFAGPALQPDDARQAARMNQLIGIADWYFHPQVGATIVFQRFIKPLIGGSTDEEACVAAVPNAKRCIEAITALKGDGLFLVGDTITLADLMLAPHLAFFAMTPEGDTLLAEAPALTDWLAAMQARSSMISTDFFRPATAA